MKNNWVATVEFKDTDDGDIRDGMQAIQESLVSLGRGKIQRVQVSPRDKRNKSAFDRSSAILLEMHRGMSIPHPMSWNTLNGDAGEDGKDVWEVMDSAIAVTTDPDDARLLTALTQIVWSKTNAKERLRELVLAYVTGDDPGAVIRGLGANPDPGMDLDALQSWFMDWTGSKAPMLRKTEPSTDGA